MLIPLGFLDFPTGAASSYELIESQIITSPVASVTFSSIAADYEHLQIRSVARQDAAGDGNIQLQLNNLTNGYSRHLLGSNGSTPFSGNATGQTYIWMPMATGSGDSAGSFGSAIIDILDYASTSKNKTVRAYAGRIGSARYFAELSGFVADSSALTTIKFTTLSGNFIAGSRFSLYGWKGA